MWRRNCKLFSKSKNEASRTTCGISSDNSHRVNKSFATNESRQELRTEWYCTRILQTILGQNQRVVRDIYDQAFFVRKSLLEHQNISTKNIWNFWHFVRNVCPLIKHVLLSSVYPGSSSDSRVHFCSLHVIFKSMQHFSPLSKYRHIGGTHFLYSGDLQYVE